MKSVNDYSISIHKDTAAEIKAVLAGKSARPAHNFEMEETFGDGKSLVVVMPPDTPNRLALTLFGADNLAFAHGEVREWTGICTLNDGKTEVKLSIH